MPDLVVGSGGNITHCPREQETDNSDDDNLQLQPLRHRRRTLRAARESNDPALLAALCDYVTRSTPDAAQRDSLRLHVEDTVQTVERRLRGGEAIRTTMAMRRAELSSRLTMLLPTGEVLTCDESHVRTRFAVTTEQCTSDIITTSDMNRNNNSQRPPVAGTDANMLPRVLMYVNTMPAITCASSSAPTSSRDQAATQQVIWVPGPKPHVTLERRVSEFRLHAAGFVSARLVFDVKHAKRCARHPYSGDE